MRRSDWVFPTAVLSLYGFFANCRPAEPFLTPYLVGPKNISEEVVRSAFYFIFIIRFGSEQPFSTVQLTNIIYRAHVPYIVPCCLALIGFCMVNILQKMKTFL